MNYTKSPKGEIKTTYTYNYVTCHIKKSRNICRLIRQLNFSAFHCAACYDIDTHFVNKIK